MPKIPDTHGIEVELAKRLIEVNWKLSEIKTKTVKQRHPCIEESIGILESSINGNKFRRKLLEIENWLNSLKMFKYPIRIFLLDDDSSGFGERYMYYYIYLDICECHCLADYVDRLGHELVHCLQAGCVPDFHADYDLYITNFQNEYTEKRKDKTYINIYDMGEYAYFNNPLEVQALAKSFMSCIDVDSIKLNGKAITKAIKKHSLYKRVRKQMTRKSWQKFTGYITREIIDRKMV